MQHVSDAVIISIEILEVPEDVGGVTAVPVFVPALGLGIDQGGDLIAAECILPNLQDRIGDAGVCERCAVEGVTADLGQRCRDNYGLQAAAHAECISTNFGNTV